MRTVIGYSNGKTQYRDEGPGRARVSGYGGSTVGHALTPLKPQPRHSPPLREKDRRRKERKEHPICGAILGIIKEPCYRAPGHKDSHRSKEAMENDKVRRRTFRRPETHQDVA